MASAITLTAEQTAEVEKLKDIGNNAFAKGKHEEAIDAFSKAIAIDVNNHVLFSNRSAAYTALGKKDALLLEKAVEDGERCVQLNPSFAKGYVRQGTALFMLKRYDQAVKAYAAGMAHEPSNKLLLDGIAQAQKHLASSVDMNDEMKASNDVVIGIDLGTTYSCVGVWKDKRVVMIPNERGAITSPSWVSFSDQGKRYIGQAAKNMAARFPSNTIFDIKRIIGQRFDDEGVATDVDRFPFKVIGSSNENGKAAGKPMVEVDMGMHGKKQFAPEEVSAMVLGYLKKTAEDFLKHPVTKAVITVPAYFNDSQRSATKAAGRIAGLDVLRIINEPTAAALSYGLDRLHKDKPAKVLIFDLGGGTFDVSVLAIEGGVTEVKATGGDTRLGGEDFDVNLTKQLIKESVEAGKPDISGDKRAVRRLQTAVEQAKRELSSANEATINIEGLFTTNEKKKGDSQYKTLDYTATVSRKQFETVNMALFTKCIETVRKVLKDAKIKAEEIDDVVLVGGSTRVPKIQELLISFFGKKELCKSLNPDEAVAYGAAVQGAILNGRRDESTGNMLLMDVTPLSLGIETTGRIMSVVVPRNTTIPCTKTQTYTTEGDYQTEIDVVVYEGERGRTTENNLLGKFTISGIERAKRGVPKIDVSFAIDSNGILNVSARDQTTGAEAKTTIERSGRSSEADIEKMIKDAQKFKLEDEENVKKVEAFHELEATINELKETAMGAKNAEKVRVLDEAADSAAQWAEEHQESAKVSEIKMKRKALETVLAKYHKNLAK